MALPARTARPAPLSSSTLLRTLSVPTGPCHAGRGSGLRGGRDRGEGRTHPFINPVPPREDRLKEQTRNPLSLGKRFRDNGKVKHSGAQVGRGPLGDGSIRRLQEATSPPHRGRWFSQALHVDLGEERSRGEGARGRVEEMARLPPFPPSQPRFTSQEEMWHFGFKKHERHCLSQL